ncbi:MAG: hypothetical protein OXT07_03930 [bacterium]|nr:hypothetical protein [bacterium]
MNRRETVERAAEQWAKELTDESGRNRLLYYRVLNRLFASKLGLGWFEGPPLSGGPRRFL